MQHSQSHYDFTGLDNKEPKIEEICFWEYARECLPLIKAVAAFMRAVAGFTREKNHATLARLAYGFIPGTKHLERTIPQFSMGEEAIAGLELIERAAADISAIVPRFNWGILCSADFPARPWLEGEIVCPIRRAHCVVPHAPNVLSGEQGRVASLRFYEGSVEDDANWSDELAEEIRDVDANRQTGTDSSFHAIIIHGWQLASYTRPELLQAIKTYLDRVSPRRLTSRNPFPSRAERDHPADYLRRLGAMRILHEADSCSMADVFGAFDDAFWDQMELLDLSRVNLQRRRAIEVFQELFNVDPAENPLSGDRFGEAEPRRDGDVFARLLGGAS